MKKSFMAIAISSVIFLSACDDKEKNALAAQVQQSTQEISQLKSELEKAKSAFPALKVEIETLFDKKEIVKHQKDPNGDNEFFLEETPVHLGITMPKTSVEWLNALLYNHFIQNLGSKFDAQGNKVPHPKAELGKERETALDIIQKQFDLMITTAKEEPSTAYTGTIEHSYLAQRNNLVIFSQLYNSYSGGAHGMHWMQYLNIDVDKRIILQLSDLFSEEEQKIIKERLWKEYKAQWEETTGASETFISKADFDISSEFYFSDSGLIFAYPPYALGPYAMGTVNLMLSWDEINQYLPKEYQQDTNKIDSEFK